MDLAPEPDGEEQNPYHETLVFEGIGDARNAEQQVLKVVRYQQIVRRKSNDEIFHDQTGYWMWDEAANQVMFSLAIPRAVSVLAAGSVESGTDGSVEFKVSAILGDPDWGILQSAFMREKASTKSFALQLTVGGDRLRYQQSTQLEIYGKSFEHTDQNELNRKG
jgi:hypothetical protein